MRAGNTYRGSRRNEARALRLNWRGLDVVNSGSAERPGTRKVKYPFERLGKKVGGSA